MWGLNLRKSLAFSLCASSFLYSNSISAKNLGDNFELYGKISMAAIGQAGAQSLNNNSSRFGFKYKRDDLLEKFTTGLRAEFGINTSNTSQNIQSIPNTTGRFQVDNTSDRPFSTRLAYLWIERGDFNATLGKNWSVWYDVTEMTDIFMVTGAFASSTYTANSEVIGTSRGVDLLEARYKLGDFHFGAQTKFTGDETADYDSDGDGIDDAVLTLEHSIAASLRYIKKNFKIGLAAINLNSNNNGIEHAKLSVTAGAQYYFDHLFLAAIYGDTKDLELIDGRFVTSENIEAILGWRFNLYHQVMLGYNWQISDEKGLDDYEMSKILGSYIFTNGLYQLGMEFVLDDSVEANGMRPKNHQFILGATMYF
ncbi:porin [Halobacteriovorax sp. HFRX-2_2]|uniref:porin n=1 Tax=unclassified Halobacteriovorax TaxID=2639665 RepID=UPI003721D168